MSDDQDVRSKGAQYLELTIENRESPDPERALVASAEPPRLPPGKDRCSPHLKRGRESLPRDEHGNDSRPPYVIRNVAHD